MSLINEQQRDNAQQDKPEIKPVKVAQQQPTQAFTAAENPTSTGQFPDANTTSQPEIAVNPEAQPEQQYNTNFSDTLPPFPKTETLPANTTPITLDSPIPYTLFKDVRLLGENYRATAPEVRLQQLPTVYTPPVDTTTVFNRSLSRAREQSNRLSAAENREVENFNQAEWAKAALENRSLFPNTPDVDKPYTQWFNNPLADLFLGSERARKDSEQGRWSLNNPVNVVIPGLPVPTVLSGASFGRSGSGLGGLSSFVLGTGSRLTAGLTGEANKAAFNLLRTFGLSESDAANYSKNGFLGLLPENFRPSSVLGFNFREANKRNLVLDAIAGNPVDDLNDPKQSTELNTGRVFYSPRRKPGDPFYKDPLGLALEVGFQLFNPGDTIIENGVSKLANGGLRNLFRRSQQSTTQATGSVSSTVKTQLALPPGKSTTPPANLGLDLSKLTEEQARQARVGQPKLPSANTQAPKLPGQVEVIDAEIVYEYKPNLSYPPASNPVKVPRILTGETNVNQRLLPPAIDPALVPPKTIQQVLPIPKSNPTQVVLEVGIGTPRVEPLTDIGSLTIRPYEQVVSQIELTNPKLLEGYKGVTWDELKTHLSKQPNLDLSEFNVIGSELSQPQLPPARVEQAPVNIDVPVDLTNTKWKKIRRPVRKGDDSLAVYRSDDGRFYRRTFKDKDIYTRELAAYKLLEGSSVVPTVRQLEGGEIITDAVDGTDLLTLETQWVKKGTQKENYERLLPAIAEGLAELHHRGVIHGDTNLANVFITKDGKLQFIDFEDAITRASQPNESAFLERMDDELLGFKHDFNHAAKQDNYDERKGRDTLGLQFVRAYKEARARLEGKTPEINKLPETAPQQIKTPPVNKTYTGSQEDIIRQLYQDKKDQGDLLTFREVAEALNIEDPKELHALLYKLSREDKVELRQAVKSEDPESMVKWGIPTKAEAYLDYVEYIGKIEPTPVNIDAPPPKITKDDLTQAAEELASHKLALEAPLQQLDELFSTTVDFGRKPLERTSYRTLTTESVLDVFSEGGMPQFLPKAFNVVPDNLKRYLQVGDFDNFVNEAIKTGDDIVTILRNLAEEHNRLLLTRTQPTGVKPTKALTTTPTKVFHGTSLDGWTPDYNIQQFGSRGELGSGLYLTTDVNAASQYALATVGKNVNPETLDYDLSPAVYELQSSLVNTLDARAKLPSNDGFYKELMIGLPQELANRVAKAINKTKNTTYTGFLTKLESNLVKSGLEPTEDVLQQVQDTVSTNLRRLGYDSVYDNKSGFVNVLDETKVNISGKQQLEPPNASKSALSRYNADAYAAKFYPDRLTTDANLRDSASSLLQQIRANVDDRLAEVQQQLIARGDDIDSVLPRLDEPVQTSTPKSVQELMDTIDNLDELCG